MATRQGIDTALTNRLGADKQDMFIAVKAEFDTSVIRVWTGIDDLSVGGETYTGAGDLLAISSVEDSAEIKSSGVSVSISGMDTTVLNLALTENYQNRFLTIFLGYLMGGTDQVAGTITLFKGRMQTMAINDDPNGSTITIDAENRLIDLGRPSNFRYTSESQEFLHPGDTGFRFVASLQDREIVWGRSSSTTGGGGGGVGNGRGGGGVNPRFEEAK